MQYSDLTDFLSTGHPALTPGAVAVLLMEDYCETNSTIRHHIDRGIGNIIALGPQDLEISHELRDKVHHVVHDFSVGDILAALNTLIEALQGRWIYYGYNAEYLFYPYCESRSMGELCAFAGEERRQSILTYVIDLYADDLQNHPNGVCLSDAFLDRSGYYAMTRRRGDAPLERQLDMFGGLRWRFEEHIPHERRKIDRIGIFKAQKGLRLRDDHTFNIEEYNTYACPWHNNATAAICSFRAAKSLRTNPGSAEGITTFTWNNSRKFAWHSHQLLDLGLMEPGQWF